jgi:hypothetical protein
MTQALKGRARIYDAGRFVLEMHVDEIGAAIRNFLGNAVSAV